MPPVLTLRRMDSSCVFALAVRLGLYDPIHRGAPEHWYEYSRQLWSLRVRDLLPRPPGPTGPFWIWRAQESAWEVPQQESHHTSME